MSQTAFIFDLSENPEYQPILNGTPQTCGMRSGKVYLNPNEDCGQHTTGCHEEMLIFLAGKGTAVVGDKNLEVGLGKIAYIPPQTVHNIKNTGSEPLIYIYCVAPATEENKL